MDKTPKESSSEIKKLTALNEFLENYFRNTIIPQLFVDENLILRKFTPPAMKQFDLKDNVLGLHISEIVHHIRFPTFLGNIQEVIDSGEDLEKEIQTTDMRWFQMNILPYKIKETNKTNGVVITFINITDRIKNLKEIEKLNSDHETFIYSVSHDLKGPVANLEGLVKILREVDAPSSKEYTGIVDMVDSSVGNLKQIIEELADITKTKKNLTKGPERINFENILEDVKLTLRDRINESKAKIHVEINVSEISFVRKNLRSILYNLISNAIKYRAPDKHPNIHIRTVKTEGYVLLTISDNGIGIEENRLKDIFTKFSRISESLEGSGIGLYIVTRMVQNSGGKIEVESEPGKGSTFKIYFKREE